MTPTTRHALAAALCALAAGGAGAQAQAQAQAQAHEEELYLRGLAAVCANCHGTEGRGAPESAFPPLAGVPRQYLLDQLKAFKSGAAPAFVMHQLSKGFSDAQLEALATYFSRLPK